jgi:hypothetical protein
MPNALVKSFSEKTGLPVQEIESKWDNEKTKI